MLWLSEWSEEVTTGVEGPQLQTRLVHGSFQRILPVHPPVNGYLTHFNAGKGEGSEKEE